MRIALFSNVNVEPVAALLERKGLSVWTPAGYGAVFDALADPASGFPESDAEAVFIVVDTCALLADCFDEPGCEAEVDKWFAAARGLLPSSMPVYVTDGSCRKDPYCADKKHDARVAAEMYWNARLRVLAESISNVFVLPYARVANEIGLVSFYSEKLWYLARMPHTSRGQQAIASAILKTCRPSSGKKVLALDLDNTLWGGVVGDLGAHGVELSDEHLGLVYKDVQRETKRMQRAGVVLVAVSKNNQEDALSVFRENDHMVLDEDDFSAMRLNWERKDSNIAGLASELNLGVDSFAFFDDSPSERELVSRMLGDVEVIDFPRDISELPGALRSAYVRLFRPDIITEEDRRKGEQYASYAKRAELEATASNFEDYLRDLNIRVRAVDPQKNLARVAQLIGKTNQFNVTTIRRTREEVASLLDDDRHVVSAYEVIDRFGNNGITAVSIVDMNDTPKIDTLILSCRIMGKRIEDYMVGRIEQSLREQGYDELQAEYRPTAKNAPVKDLFDRLGYERVGEDASGAIFYSIRLDAASERKTYVKGE